VKLLFLGLVPVVIFWFVEDKFGTVWGLIAAIVWAIGECIYEYAKNRRVDGLTLFSTGLVVVLGGLGALLDKSILFKFQPVIMEVVFAGILVWGGRGGEPLLLKMAKKTRPEIFANPHPVILEAQTKMMKRLTRNLIVVLIIHSILLSYVAVKGTTGQWAFWKGVGFNVFVLLWAFSEFLIMRMKNKKPSVSQAEEGRDSSPK
jgi:intracellular septation protein A